MRVQSNVCSSGWWSKKYLSDNNKKLRSYLKAKAACLKAKQVNPNPNLAVTKTGSLLGGRVSGFTRQPKTSKTLETFFSANKKKTGERGKQEIQEQKGSPATTRVKKIENA